MSIQDFKTTHKRFIEALRYILANEQKLKADPAKWQKIKANFEQKFERPMDEAWQGLTSEERKRLAPIYLHQKALQDETVRKVIDIFGAEIKSVEENEKISNNIC